MRRRRRRRPNRVGRAGRAPVHRRCVGLEAFPLRSSFLSFFALHYIGPLPSTSLTFFSFSFLLLLLLLFPFSFLPSFLPPFLVDPSDPSHPIPSQAEEAAAGPSVRPSGTDKQTDRQTDGQISLLLLLLLPRQFSSLLNIWAKKN